MSEKLHFGDFKWVEKTSTFNEYFHKKNNKDNDIGYFIEAGVLYPEELDKLHNDSPFLQERLKNEKVERVIANVHDNDEYDKYIRNIKQALNHRLIQKKVHRVIKLKQETGLKQYINTTKCK